jgi:putative nucleotidyltransferase with HDIG domain
MLVAAALYFLANTAMVAAAVSFERGQRFTDTWRTYLAHLSLNFFGGAYAALLLVLLSPTLSLTASILLTPIPLLLYAVFRSWTGRINDRIAFLDSTNRQYKATIAALAQAVDAKDQVTHGHIQRVQTASLALAQRLRPRDTDLLPALEAASLLHDLGKIAIPEHILNKPGKLSEAEYARMKEHAAIGADIISAIDFPYPVVPIVRHHHENWDGSGYPDGLRGDAIPIGARILAVVDCFDALVSDRPYRPKVPLEEAIAILRERRGRWYDPAVVDAFIATQPTPLPVESSRAPLVADLVPPESIEPAVRGPSPVQRLDQRFFVGIGETILQLACHRLKATAGVLFAYDNESDSLHAAVICGEVPQEMRVGAIKRGVGLSGWVAATERPQINADARLDFGGTANAGDSQLRMAMTVPVSTEIAFLGVITLYGTDPFPTAFLSSLELLASALATTSIPVIAPAPMSL